MLNMKIEIIGTKRESRLEKALKDAKEFNRDMEAKLRREKLSQKVQQWKTKVGNTKEKSSSSLDDLILYAGDFTKGRKKGCALILLDPATGNYEVLARENSWTFTAIPYGDKILYAGAFTKGLKKGCALTLLDPATGKSKVLARVNKMNKRVNNLIFTAVPVDRKIFGKLL